MLCLSGFELIFSLGAPVGQTLDIFSLLEMVAPILVLWVLSVKYEARLSY